MEKSTVMLSARVWGRQYDVLRRPLVGSYNISPAVQVLLENDMDDSIDAYGALEAG
jgi:hypothetical protein